MKNKHHGCTMRQFNNGDQKTKKKILGRLAKIRKSVADQIQKECLTIDPLEVFALLYASAEADGGISTA